MPNRERYLNPTTIIVAAAGVASIVYIFTRYRRSLKKINFTGSLFKRQTLGNIHIVDNKEDCESVVRQLKSRCSEYRVLGFDCEWLTVNGSRHPIALLQLSSHDGLCALFRLSKINFVPSSLREILEDASILKVGVAPIDDARYLMHDYAVNVKATLDLRFMALMAHRRPEGLAALSKTYIDVELDKNWRIRCSDWEANELSDIQVEYAAKDAQVAVQIFKKLDELLVSGSSFNWQRFFAKNNDWSNVYNRCKHYADIRFKNKPTNKSTGKSSDDPVFHNLLSRQQQHSLVAPSVNKKISRKYSIATRRKPLYHNCFLEAPDGELLCTCDTKKAEWYVEKGIGEVVKEDPFTVRLKFEPAGRSVGEVGHFYRTVKENRCVVCGKAETYIRKNVVPREYRRLFPAIMKDHSSHDVLLLCINCHQLSNLADQNLRLRLAKQCDATIIDKLDPKFVEDLDMKKVRSAGRALLNMRNGKYSLPPDRVVELENILFSNYVDCSEITDDIIKEAAKVQVVFENANFESHGEKVVEYFQKAPGGLLSLEHMWRLHFLESMAPQYLPALWSVDHNKSRLEIRIKEGRIDPEDVVLAGLVLDADSRNV